MSNRKSSAMGLFERWLTLWVALCIVCGVVLGKLAPGIAKTLDGMTLDVGGAPVVSVPIAICLFFMMYPIMVKIDFAAVVRAGRAVRPVGLTLFINWAVKPFTMYAIAFVFLGVLFRGFIGDTAMDLVKLPFGVDLPVGATYGAGTVGPGRRRADARNPVVAQLSGGVHSARHCALHGDGSGLGVSGAW